MKLRIFYMMNGMNILAELVERPDERLWIKDGVLIILGQNQQVALMNAFPFTEPGTEMELNENHIMASSSMDWNKGMIKQYEDFWTQLRAKAAGIIPSASMPVKGNPADIIKNLKR